MRRKSKAEAAATPEDATRLYYYWLLGAIFFEYGRPASFLPFLNIPLIYSLIPIGLLVATLFAKGLRPMSVVTRDPLLKWIYIYVGMVALSVSYSLVHEFAFNTFKSAFGYGILCVLIARIVDNDKRLLGVIATLVVSHMFLIAMNPNILTQPETRNYVVGATFLGDGNDFGLSLCILVPFAIEYGLSATKFWHKLLIWLSLAVMLFAIIASQSRGASLGLGAVIIYLWVKSPRKGLTLILVFFAVGAGLLYAPANYFDRMKTLADYENEGSAAGRIEIWKGGTRMALDNPLFGVGAGNFPVAYGTKYKPADTVAWKNAHSAYFMVWGELGTIGIIVFFVLLLGNIFRNSKVRSAILARAGPKPDPLTVKHARRLYILTASMLGYIVPATFLSAAYYPHVFILTGLFIAVRATALAETGTEMNVVAKRGRPARLNRPAPPLDAKLPPAK